MTIQSQANTYAVAVGTAPTMVPFVTTVAPASTNLVGPNGPFKIGQTWINTTDDAAYILADITSSQGVVSASWIGIGGGSSDVNTLTGDTGTATPSAGNIKIAGGSGITTAASGSTITVSLNGGSTAIDSFTPDAGTSPVVPTALGLVTMAGTANQITTTGGTNSLTFSVPSSFIAPGSIASTTTMTAGTGLTVSAGGAAITGTTTINTSGSAVTTIGTGGTGATNIGNATGNTAVTGSLTASTTLTATLGAITATNGNFVGSTAGTGILLNSPSASGAASGPVVVNGRSGQATFTTVSIAANADLTLTITNSAITGSSTQIIYSLSGVTTGAALSIKSVTNSAGSSAVVVTNGSGDTTSTANITLTFLVLN